MQIIPVCLSIVARRKGVSATRRGGLNWTPISLLVGHPCKLFHKLKALIEFEKEPWASDMTTILLDAKKIRDIARSQGQDAVEPEAIKEIERRYDACCEQAITVHENQLSLTPESEKRSQVDGNGALDTISLFVSKT